MDGHLHPRGRRSRKDEVLSLSFQSAQEDSRSDAQGMGQPEDVHEGDVDLSSLDGPNKGPV